MAEGLPGLSESDRQLLKRLLSEPIELPEEFRSWLVSYLETSGIRMLQSQVSGAIPVGRLAGYPGDSTMALLGDGTWGTLDPIVPYVYASTPPASHTSSGNWQALPLSQEANDTDSMHDGASNGQRITFNTDGVYVVSAQVCFAMNATGVRGLQIMRNTDTANTNTLGIASCPGITGITNVLNIVLVQEFFSGGDFISLAAYQNSGGNLAYQNIPGSKCFFSAVRVGPAS